MCVNFLNFRFEKIALVKTIIRNYFLQNKIILIDTYVLNLFS